MTNPSKGPADIDWTKPDFAETDWKQAAGISEVAEAVPPDTEVWVRIHRELPWELINNTYYRLTLNGAANVYVNGKSKGAPHEASEIKKAYALSPGREEKTGWNVYAFHLKSCKAKPTLDLEVVHEPWVDTPNPEMKPQPLIEEHLRDANIIVGGDGKYYMTGTFAGTTGDGLLFYDYNSPKHWKNNDGVKLYRSSDLKNWTDLGWVWTFAKNATWCKTPASDPNPDKNGRQGIFAPKLSYINGKYALAYGVNFSGPGHPAMGVGIAVADKPEGPYHETSPDKPITNGYDAQIFQDDDGQCYLIRNGPIFAKLKPDLSGLAEPERNLTCANYPFVGFEGSGLVKRNGIYYMMGAEILQAKGGKTIGPSMVASSKNIHGPYGNRYTLLQNAGGHSRPFQAKDGQWWTASYTWDNASHRFTIFGLSFDPDGTIRANGKTITKE